MPISMDKLHEAYHRGRDKTRMQKLMARTQVVVMYILRHGTTGANTRDQFRGLEDFELNEKGITEAHEAAEWFLENGIKPTKIISSPMSRAVATAEILGTALGVGVGVDEHLLPLDVGEFTGEYKDEVWDDFVHYLDHPDEEIPGGDSVKAFATALCEALDTHLEEASTDGPIVLVAHTSDMVVADCYYRTGEVGMACRPEEKEIVEPGGVVAVSATKKLWPVFKDAKGTESAEKIEHEEYDEVRE